MKITKKQKITASRDELKERSGHTYGKAPANVGVAESKKTPKKLKVVANERTRRCITASKDGWMVVRFGTSNDEHFADAEGPFASMSEAKSVLKRMYDEDYFVDFEDEHIIEDESFIEDNGESGQITIENDRYTTEIVYQIVRESLYDPADYLSGSFDDDEYEDDLATL